MKEQQKKSDQGESKREDSRISTGEAAVIAFKSAMRKKEQAKRAKPAEEPE